MSSHRQRLARLERRQQHAAPFQHTQHDGWAIIARAGKAIVALLDNGRWCHA